MNKLELKQALEAILMVVDEPAQPVSLAQVLETPTEGVVEALNELAQSGESKSSGKSPTSRFETLMLNSAIE